MNMRTTILTTILLLPLTTFGQIVDHFENLDSKWFVAATYPDANLQNPNFVATKTTIYGFKGDTLIDEEKWLKIYSSSDSLLTTNLRLKGFIKSTNNFVLFMDINNQIDTLYNFNLSVGDSVLYDLGSWTEYIPISDIDSIQINGQFYKRFKFAEPKGPNAFDILNEIWIEGIGSIHGPLFPAESRKFSTETPDSIELTCSHSNGQLYWQNSSYNDCFVNIMLSIVENHTIDFNIFPNPFNDIVTFNLNNSQTIYIVVYNCQGQKLISKRIDSYDSAIDLRNLPFGLYILRYDFDGQTGTKKLIKKY
jgi:hypothetical protein